MKTFEDTDILVLDPTWDSSHSQPELPEKKVARGRILLLGGLLGVVGAAFIFAMPELGVASAVGGFVASAGSAGMTLLARR